MPTVTLIKLRSKSFYQSSLLLGFLLLSFLSVTDFGLFLSHVFILLPLLLVAYYLTLKLIFSRIFIDSDVIIYFIFIAILFLINTLFGSSFNLLLFMPFISYSFFKLIQLFHKDKTDKEIDRFIKLLVLVFVGVAVLELSVKLMGFNLIGYKEFLLKYGDHRIDVLRVRTLFGSPLSTAALCIFFFMYFLFFSKSYLFLFFTTVLAFLSGSRTAIVLLILMSCFSGFFSVYQKRIKRKAIYYLLSGMTLLVAVAILTPVGKIVVRAVTLQADASFVSRSHTTVQTSWDLLTGLPGTLFVGLRRAWTSDSAITSIMASSGALAFLAFFSLFVLLLIKTRVSNLYKFAIALNVVLGASMIGDFFVPAVSFLYFMVFMAYSKQCVVRDSRSPCASLPNQVVKR